MSGGIELHCTPYLKVILISQFRIIYLPTQTQKDIVYRETGFNREFFRCTNIINHLICSKKNDGYVFKG